MHPRTILAGLCSLAVLAGVQYASGQVVTRGAEVSNERVSVNSASHWEHWSIPTHAVDIVGDAVVPHYFRMRFNVLEDFRSYRRSIDGLKWPVDDKFRVHGGVGAFTAVPNVQRTFSLDANGEMKLRNDLNMEKYLDSNFLKYPGNEAHLVIDGVLFVVEDTTMTAAKEGVLTLRNARTGRTSRLNFATKDKLPFPIYEYSVRQGVSRLGSGSVDQEALFDGDPDTFWEPDADDPIENWWIEIDLGRTVLVDEIVLKFVDAGNGDPFRQFKVLTEPGQELILEEAGELEFAVVAGTDAPNEDQRSFSFRMEDTQDAAPGWDGRMVETVRIVVFDTKGSRHSRLASETEWQALDAEDRGDIIHFVRDQGGFEEPVSREEYDQLPSQRQGRKEYYRRERPRLAEVEVWGLGDNIGPGIKQGGGSFDVIGEGVSSPIDAFDGDFNTYFSQQLPTPTLAQRGLMVADLGAIFWLDQLRISAVWIRSYTTVFDGYIHRGSDGTRDARGRLKWTRLSSPEREKNQTPQYLQLKDEYPEAPRIRFLETRIVSERDAFRTSSEGAGIVEYQLYTRAYPAEVILESDLFALPGTRNLGRIFWDADTPPGTGIEVRTRSGDLLGKVVRYFDDAGKEISLTAWKSLRRPPLPDTSFVPTSGWSPWSNVYQESGDRVTSPGLRKYIQSQVKLVTDEREAAAGIRSLEIELVAPVGERILAEVWPSEVSDPGVVDTFEVYIRPNFIEDPAPSRSLGFDEILLELGGGGIELLELAVGDDPASGTADRTFRPDDGIFVDREGAGLDVLRNGADSIWVRLPELQTSREDAEPVYHRIASEGDEVPVDQNGVLLSAAAYGLLSGEEQGAVKYFRLEADGALTEVDHLDYVELDPSEQGPVRYFRVLQGDGSQFPFAAGGDTLTSAAYSRLGRDERGSVVAAGNLMRVTFAAPVYRNGTTLGLAARNSRGGTDPDAPWQTIEAGDATPAFDGNTLSIGVPLSLAALSKLEISPNPFTPNGDGINDVARIGLSVFKITTGRELGVSIHSLDGRRVWDLKQVVSGGAHTIQWLGVDNAGQSVPPGLYICRILLDVDSEEQEEAAVARLISVAY